MFLLCDVHDMIHSCSLYKSLAAPTSFWMCFSGLRERVISPQTWSSLWDLSTSGSERSLLLRIAGRFYPPSDVLMQRCLQGQRWTLMNKYEDNLHLCCTFSLPIPHMVLLKRRIGKKKKTSDFQKKPLGYCISLCARACAGLCVMSMCVFVRVCV